MDNHKQAKDLAQQLTASDKQWQQKRQHEKQQEAQSEALTDKLWPMMADMYGHKFVSQYGEIAPDTWVKCLKGITGQQIAKGLNTCITDCPIWPPTAPQFRFMCLGIAVDSKGQEIAHAAGMYSTKQTAHMIEKEKLTLESDTMKSRRKQVASNAIAEMMDGLGGPTAKEPDLERKPCKHCLAVFESILTICPKCEGTR